MVSRKAIIDEANAKGMNIEHIASRRQREDAIDVLRRERRKLPRAQRPLIALVPPDDPQERGASFDVVTLAPYPPGSPFASKAEGNTTQ